jgi:hypothetical protein
VLLAQRRWHQNSPIFPTLFFSLLPPICCTLRFGWRPLSFRARQRPLSGSASSFASQPARLASFRVDRFAGDVRRQTRHGPGAGDSAGDVCASTAGRVRATAPAAPCSLALATATELQQSLEQIASRRQNPIEKGCGRELQRNGAAVASLRIGHVRVLWMHIA